MQYIGLDCKQCKSSAFVPIPEASSILKDYARILRTLNEVAKLNLITFSKTHSGHDVRVCTRVYLDPGLEAPHLSYEGLSFLPYPYPHPSPKSPS